MQEVTLAQVPNERVMTRVFRGYSRYRAPLLAKKGGATYLAECMNMASEQYPCAYVREPRETAYMTDRSTGNRIDLLPGKVLDVISHGGTLAYLLADGSVMCGKKRWTWDTGKTLTEGRLYQFGAGIVCPALNMYIPDVRQSGKMPLAVLATAKWNLTYTNETGEDFPDAAEAATAPTNPAPEDDDHYYNTTDNKLYRYDGAAWNEVTEGYFHDTTNDGVYLYNSSTGLWESYEVRHMKLLPVPASLNPVDIAIWTAALICCKMIRAGDHITITDSDEAVDDVGTVNVSYIRDWETEGAGIVIDTVCDQRYKAEMTVKRRPPLFDHAVVHDNRVWACRYGTSDDGAFVNEIYACKLGDPTNWNSREGLADDSYTVSCGEPGDWTGAAVVGDNVVFFKEHCMYTIYGDTPDAYTVRVDYCSGIEKGSDRSAALINGYTYYNSPIGVMRLYPGTLPVKISDDISSKQCLAFGIGGTDGRKYYLRAYDDRTRQNKLFVFDTALEEWHVEDQIASSTGITSFVHFVSEKNEMMAVCGSNAEGTDYATVRHIFVSPPAGSRRSIKRLYLCQAGDDGLIYPGDGYENATDENHETESVGSWSFTTGLFGLDDPDYKRVKSVSIRAWLDVGATFDADIQYDDNGKWEPLEISSTFVGGETGTNRVEYRLRRCDLYRLRLRGTGRACVYSITHVYEGDGNRSYGGNAV